MERLSARQEFPRWSDAVMLPAMLNLQQQLEKSSSPWLKHPEQRRSVLECCPPACASNPWGLDGQAVWLPATWLSAATDPWCRDKCRIEVCRSSTDDSKGRNRHYRIFDLTLLIRVSNASSVGQFLPLGNHLRARGLGVIAPNSPPVTSFILQVVGTTHPAPSGLRTVPV